MKTLISNTIYIYSALKFIQGAKTKLTFEVCIRADLNQKLIREHQNIQLVILEQSNGKHDSRAGSVRSEITPINVTEAHTLNSSIQTRFKTRAK